MKRFHVHIAVTDLPANIAFYTKLFGRPPSTQKPDYAKWMLDDPRVNFALSSHGHVAGVNHFGMQADSAEELTALKTMADAASDDTTIDQGEAACCYAKSEKHWIIDPEGLAWEHFLTMSDSQTYGDDNQIEGEACCIPLHAAENSDKPQACCIPQDTDSGHQPCCE